ncbi:carbon storage regulator [Roseovarius nitratireducens]|uniref:carbon storage regulator n=1 Tax=Roseovarius nitratireducens TaxID=2044597 RepID=UPI000CE240B2|nr:carbon storage regulator [Roseovarius nitratireducens]
MLVLRLKASDRVQVGDLVFEIKEAAAGRVRIAFGAPKSIPIHNDTSGGPPVFDLDEPEGGITLHSLE